MGFFSKLFGFEKIHPPRPLPISSVLAENHPAVMLYGLTRQAFTKEDSPLVLCAKDIVRESETQLAMSQKYKQKLNEFFVTHPSYQERLKTHTVPINDIKCSLGFILEILFVFRSNIPRKMIAQSNFDFQDQFGSIRKIPFIESISNQSNKWNTQTKENFMLEVADIIESRLDKIDLEFIEHIKNVLLEINKYYGSQFEFFMGYNNFDDTETQYPAMAFYIDKYELEQNFKYNFSKELRVAYNSYLKEDKVYHLRIFNILETINYYIEMCTRYKVYMVISFGYHKVYTRKYDSLNGSNFKSKIKESLGEKYIEAIDKCIEVMCSSSE